jgi:predicted nuclease with TOPRIM domain
MDGVKAELQKKEQIEKANARIAELNEQKKELQKAKAQLQGKEDLVADFERAKMDEVERRVNVLFQFVQFRMYRQQIEDAKQVPDCVCYIDGVRYGDKNNAGQINAGLDVINALCSFYKTNAPIFIDNAESVNEFIPVASQLIKLVVTEGDFTVNNL